MTDSAALSSYTDDNIKTLDWQEHIRRRPGMYIGKLGDGASPDDGIYILLKEVLDNSIDEYAMGFGKRIDIKIGEDGAVSVRDFGRGIPLGKVVEVASKMNTGGKYDSRAFKKSVGLNGVGIKAVNALSAHFDIRAFREGQMAGGYFCKGMLSKEHTLSASTEANGTMTSFIPDEEVFGTFKFNLDYVETMLRNYTYLNAGLIISLNGAEFISKNGLLDLLNENLGESPLYEPIHLKGEDIEITLTHGSEYGETYFSFVNGQHTTQGGTHLAAFKEAIVRTIKEFFKKDFEPADVRGSIVAAVSVKVEEPVFESQTKTKLGSKDMGPNGPTVRNFVLDFLQEALDNFLHKHSSVAEAILKKIQENEKDRKAISGIQKLARERAKKANLHNKKLRDCRVHYTDSKNEKAATSTLFITEGDSASGSITKSRDVNTQAVFSLRGKPLNCFGLTKKVVYENEEFNLLQAALDIEETLDNLRYNRVVVATDADVDGMHIRLLLITFFLQFFPDIIRQNHLYILQTPLFRVRNKKETIYCYSEEEKSKAIRKLGAKPEITRFKGLGEISPDEFREFISEDNIRLDPVRLTKDDLIHDLLEFYMGKNTQDRQVFIIDNLRQEEALEAEEELRVEN
ncbi:MAG: type IIA DNA topoisomerase subunit B [Prevotellaceae bacterium]|jgi:topoisomerase-4 subunit B|nr:type IIA DNA topoisomerase subunit B [Prevotellaceae bacterium]